MEKNRVRQQIQKNINIHNDLANAAFHFKESVEVRIAEGNLEGITFEIMACLSMLAFSFEARINFLGAKLFEEEWKERQPFNNKVDLVINKVRLSLPKNERPFSSIEKLKTFRDSIAHGKPYTNEIDEVVEVGHDEFERGVDLSAGWENVCTKEVMTEVYEDIEDIWDLLLVNSGIKLIETLTRGSKSLTPI